MLENYISKKENNKIEDTQKNKTKQFNFRTDLANERRDIYKKANSIENEINGIESTKEEINENISVERVKKDLKKLLSDYRYEHSLRVGETAEELARIYKVDEEKAYLAGITHDIAKEFTKEQNEAIMKRNRQTIDKEENPRINHAIVGAVYAKEKYHLDDEITHAIFSHTVGDIPMSILDKIVFVADKIEPGKNYPKIEEERQLAKENLDKAIILCMENNHKKLKKEKKKVAPKSIEVLSYLKKNS